MYFLVAFLIFDVVVALAAWLYISNKEKIRFYIEGMDQGFRSNEISMLWKVAVVCDLEEPLALFYSLPSLTKCIAQIKAQSEARGSSNAQKMKHLLSKLYDYRNKIEKETDKKRGLESTKSLSNGQKLRIILPGRGLFTSEIVNNGREIVISLPTQKGQIVIDGKDWIGQTVNVYLWRSGDARYVFDTTVLGESAFLGHPSLHLQHTTNLLRTQKRNAVRAKCHIYANLYILNEKDIDYNKVDTKPGYKCIIEDISEKGALIRIGGKGIPNIQLKLQFTMQNRLIIMFGIVRTVEYSEEINQSKLHFECIHLENDMKNHILSYVYNILPQSEKEIYDAISFTDKDAREDGLEEKSQDAEDERNGGNGDINENGGIISENTEKDTDEKPKADDSVEELVPVDKDDESGSGLEVIL